MEGFPSAEPVCQPFDTFDTFAQSASWTDPDLSFETDWNFLSVNQPPPFPAVFDDIPVLDIGYDTAFNSLSDSGSIEQHVSVSLAASSANSGRFASFA